MPLVDLSIAEGKLMLQVRGADKLWAFRRGLEIPLVHVTGVRADQEAARRWYHGIGMPGTNVPRVITAGTFYQDGKRVFWDVHHPEKIIVIDLQDEPYNQLIVEVDEPEAAIKPAAKVQLWQGCLQTGASKACRKATSEKVSIRSLSKPICGKRLTRLRSCAIKKRVANAANQRL